MVRRYKEDSPKKDRIKKPGFKSRMNFRNTTKIINNKRVSIVDKLRED